MKFLSLLKYFVVQKLKTKQTKKIIFCCTKIKKKKKKQKQKLLIIIKNNQNHLLYKVSSICAGL